MTNTIKNQLQAVCVASFLVVMLMLVAFQRHPQQVTRHQQVQAEKQHARFEIGDYAFGIRKSADAKTLENMRNYMSKQGFEVSYVNVEFENGKLVLLEGTINFKGVESRFRGKNFNLLVIRYKKNQNGYVFSTETDPAWLSK